MSEHDRGAYAPPTADAPLSFDARQPVRGAKPFPVTLIMTGLVLIGLIVAIALFYRSGVREAGQPPKTVGEPVGQMKSEAPADAQPRDPAAGLQIYQSESGQGAAGSPSFVPPPEQPGPRPAAVEPAPPPAAAPTSPVQSGPALRPALPPAAAPPPAPTPAPVAKAPPPPAPKPAPPAKVEPPAAAPAPAKGAATVQIGAVSSTALADKTWKDATSVAGAAGRGKAVERIERDGRVLYRTFVTGFASRTDAQAFCGRLKAAGKDCIVK